MSDLVKYDKLKSSASADVDRLVAHLRSLRLRYDFEPPAEHCYTSATLILCDAVLSANRRYKEFVLPRLELLRLKGIDRQSLSELVELIERAGEVAFTQVWNYNDLTRVRRLRNLAQRFIALKQNYGLTNDLEVLQKWAQVSTVGDCDRFGVPGIGLATFQYLRILCGIETVKPDVHLRQAVRDGLNRKVSDDKKVIELLEAASQRMSVPAKRRLDYAIWDYYSRMSKDSKKCG